MLRAATCIAATSLARSLRRLGTTMPSAATTSCPRADRDRHRARAEAHLLDGGGVVVAEHPRELAAQRARLGDRVRRDPGAGGRAPRPAPPAGAWARSTLPDPGGVHREPRPDRAHHRHGRVAREPVEVEHLGAVAHGEVHGGQRRAVQVVEVRRGELPQARLHGREQSDVPQPPPHDVLPRPACGSAHPTRPARPPAGARSAPAARPAPPARLSDRPPVLVVVRPEQRQRPARHRRPRRRHVARHDEHHSTGRKPRANGSAGGGSSWCACGAGRWRGPARRGGR